jgi:hypothetical protein
MCCVLLLYFSINLHNNSIHSERARDSKPTTKIKTWYSESKPINQIKPGIQNQNPKTKSNLRFIIKTRKQNKTWDSKACKMQFMRRGWAFLLWLQERTREDWINKWKIWRDKINLALQTRQASLTISKFTVALTSLLHTWFWKNLVKFGESSTLTSLLRMLLAVIL